MMALVFLFLALLFAFFGYLIRYRQRVDLIAGYQRGEFKDEAAFGRWFGNRLFAAAGIALVFVPFLAVFKGFELYFLLGYVTILILGAMSSDLSSQDFK